MKKRTEKNAPVEKDFIEISIHARDAEEEFACGLRVNLKDFIHIKIFEFPNRLAALEKEGKLAGLASIHSIFASDGKCYVGLDVSMDSGKDRLAAFLAMALKEVIKANVEKSGMAGEGEGIWH